VAWRASSQLNLSLRDIMKYVVYKQPYRERVRWYARPLAEGGREDYSYFFEGEEAKLLADEKARELNEKEGRQPHSTSSWEYLRFKAFP
jgi:hypothetical protein